MVEIMIEISDDKTITVTGSEDGKMMGKPYQCKDTAECAQYVDKMLNMEMGEAPGEEKMESPEEDDYSKMWKEESSKRKPQPGLMS